MSPPPIPTVSRRMRRRITALTWINLALLAIPSLFGGIYFFERIRGAAAWRAAQEEMAAEGESAHLEDVYPASVPDEQNFGAIPLLDALQNFERRPGKDLLYADPENRERFETLHIPKSEAGDTVPLGNWQVARPNDLAEIHGHMAGLDGYHLPGTSSDAGEILAALARHDTEIAEILAVVDLPHARLKNYQPMRHLTEIAAIPVPGFNKIMEATKLLSVRASASLAAGDSQTARDSIAISLRLLEAVGRHGMLIGHLVEVTGDTIILTPIWEGLQSGSWRPEDLRWLDEELGRIDLPERILACLRVETAVFGGKLPQFFPSSFMDHNGAIACRVMLRDTIRPLRERDIHAICSDPRDVPPEYKKTTPNNFLAKIATPVYSRISKRSITTQAAFDLASTACLIELHKTEHGTYPDALITLTGAPIDPVTVEPYPYARTDDGRYKLWWMGTDLDDDGGRIVAQNPGSEPIQPHRDEGDIVWAYRPEDLLPPDEVAQ